MNNYVIVECNGSRLTLSGYIFDKELVKLSIISDAKLNNLNIDTSGIVHMIKFKDKIILSEEEYEHGFYKEVTLNENIEVAKISYIKLKYLKLDRNYENTESCNYLLINSKTNEKYILTEKDYEYIKEKSYIPRTMKAVNINQYKGGE